MTALDWLRGGTVAAMDPRVDELSEQLRTSQENELLMQESLVDLQLALEDVGWRRLTAEGRVEFDRAGLRTMTELCRIMAIKNPLIKRGLSLTSVYVWGLGVQVSAPATGDDVMGEQDVNAVVQGFLDDDGNRRALTGDQAHEENERALGTDGNMFFACFTSPLTGRVQVRSVPFDEVDDVISNPQDRSEPWFYKRCWTATVVNPVTGTSSVEQLTAYYPDLRHRPRLRGKTIDGHPVIWDAPMLHVRVNALAGWKFGIPDAYAAIDWARAYKDFLEDWAKLVKALSRFAWRATTPGSKARRTAVAGALSARPSTSLTGDPNDVGATAVTAVGQTLEAIPKTGATIDSESGRPLAMMVAAALGVPVTMLLADPGQTGARATAETLDRPTELQAGSRRSLWSATFEDLVGYVIDQAVIAPGGPLRGTLARDEVTDRWIVTLAGDTSRTVQVSWPDLDELDVEKVVKAIVAADGTNKVPPLTIARLLLEALGVDDIDEVLDELTDDDGNFVDPEASAGDTAVQAFRRGQDPAAVVGDGTPVPAGQQA